MEPVDADRTALQIFAEELEHAGVPAQFHAAAIKATQLGLDDLLSP